MTPEQKEFRINEAKAFLKIARGPKDWADENSGFHIANSVSFKEMFIKKWLKSHDLITISDAVKAERERCASIAKRCYEIASIHSSIARIFDQFIQIEQEIRFPLEPPKK